MKKFSETKCIDIDEIVDVPKIKCIDIGKIIKIVDVPKPKKKMPDEDIS